MQNVLIVGAHFDDAELGAGGTAARLAAEGKNVYKLTLTDNETDFKQMNIKVSQADSADDSRRACEVLGIKEITSFEPEKCSQLYYNMQTMQKVEAIIYGYNIDTVFTHFFEDLNQDHVAASRIVITAARHCDNIFLYRSNFYQVCQPFNPSFFVDISDYITKKDSALKEYSGQHNRYNALFESNLERNHLWGFANQVSYAEGFVIQKYLLK